MTRASIQEAEDKVLKKTCEGTAPVELSGAGFDASPLEARIKMAKDKARWDCICLDVCVAPNDWKLGL